MFTKVPRCPDNRGLTTWVKAQPMRVNKTEQYPKRHVRSGVNSPKNTRPKIAG